MFSEDELTSRLEELFNRIDERYRSITEEVEFSCFGCDGVKCCTVDLPVHTFVEKLYLRRGFEALESADQLEILGLAKAMVKAKQEDPTGDSYRNSVCVLNSGGLCLLYKHRPMICRLAGIPHVIVRPDSKEITGPGCVRFERTFKKRFPGVRLDRTEFYREMASIELVMVHHYGRRSNARTISEILGSEDPEEPII